jgi:hypothetical protein
MVVTDHLNTISSKIERLKINRSNRKKYWRDTCLHTQFRLISIYNAYKKMLHANVSFLCAINVYYNLNNSFIHGFICNVWLLHWFKFYLYKCIAKLGGPSRPLVISITYVSIECNKYPYIIQISGKTCTCHLSKNPMAVTWNNWGLCNCELNRQYQWPK